MSLPRTVNGTGHTGPSEFCATGERVVLWCLYDPDANEAKPWRVQWKEGGERLASRRSRDEVRVLEPLARRAADAS